MRNELYARHGMVFSTPRWRDLFRKQPWYQGVAENVDALLSPTEQANVKLIVEAEHPTRK